MVEIGRCPPECKLQLTHLGDNLASHGRTLYGSDGKSGIAEDYVSKKRVWLFIGIMAGFIIVGISAWGKARDERMQNKEFIAVIQSELGGIKSSINEIKANQLNPIDLLNNIKKIVRESSEDCEKRDADGFTPSRTKR